MAGSGIQILDAQILTRADGIVLDTFQVMDPDYQGAPPVERLRLVGDRIASVLKGWEHVDDVLPAFGDLVDRGHRDAREATEVRIDNETSDAYTIIDVFADDRLGLLYVITNTIFQLGLSIMRPHLNASGPGRRRVLCRRSAQEIGGSRAIGTV